MSNHRHIFVDCACGEGSWCRRCDPTTTECGACEAEHPETLKITQAFKAALVHARDESMYGTEEAEASNNAAFNLADQYGWDWEADDNFMSYASKATPEEILLYGLRQAITHIRKQS